MEEKIVFYGAGSMAEAIVSGLIKDGQAADSIWLTNKQNKERLNDLKERYGVNVTHDKELLFKQASMLVLATKPKDVLEVLKELNEYLTDEVLLISVLAGVSTEKLEAHLPQDVSVIRAMPNTSAQIQLSATALAKGSKSSDSDLARASSIFEAVGRVVIVNEEEIHLVTGISGSGPAYFYAFYEAMEEVARKEGMSNEVIKELISQTMIGAGMMLRESSLSASQLRENVTSPNGTTEAGLNALEEKDFKEAIQAAVLNAVKRSKELGGG